jgi:hypothetical protein
MTSRKQPDLFDRQLKKREAEDRIISLVRWRIPGGEVPDGNLLVEVDTKDGSDVALVFIADDCQTLLCADDVEDVWTAWTWSDVSRYALLEDILPQLPDRDRG